MLIFLVSLQIFFAFKGLFALIANQQGNWPLVIFKFFNLLAKLVQGLGRF